MHISVIIRCATECSNLIAVSSRPIRWNPPRSRNPGGEGMSGLADSLALDLQLDRLAHDEPTGLERHVVGHAPVLAVDLAGHGEAERLLAAHYLRPGHDALELDRQLDRVRLVLDGELADDTEHRAVVPSHPCGTETYLGVLLGVEEVLALQVGVAHFHAGVHARRLHHRLRGRLQRVLGDGDAAGELTEPAPHLADHQVPGGEADPGVVRVKDERAWLGNRDAFEEANSCFAHGLYS